MGNRAIVIFQANSDFSPCVYLHWNGGPESVYPFLDEMDRRKIRPGDTMYESARFIQIVCEFMDQDSFSGLSLGVSNGPKNDSLKTLKHDDPGDNGIYIVSRSDSGRKVRRFKGYDNFHELSEIEVAGEKKAAYAHKYSTGKDPISQTWVGLHGDKKADGYS